MEEVAPGSKVARAGIEPDTLRLTRKSKSRVSKYVDQRNILGGIRTHDLRLSRATLLGHRE